MYRYLMMMVDRQKMKYLQFINATKAFKKDTWYLLVYFEPFDMDTSSIILDGFILQVSDNFELSDLTAKGWQLVRDVNISRLNNETQDFLAKIEKRTLTRNRGALQQAEFYQMSSDSIQWLFVGLHTGSDVVRYAKMMYLAGQSYADTLFLFAAVTRNDEKLHELFMDHALNLWQDEQIPATRLEMGDE